MSRKKREEPEVMTKGMTRREFVKGAAVGAAGVGIVASSLSLIGCGGPQEAKPWLPEKWDEEADVVVAGSGGGGLTAALTAAGEGAKVLLLEKLPTTGGTTGISGGWIWIPNNPLMKKAGIPDSREEALTYLRRVAEGQAPEKVIETFADRGPEMVEYIFENVPLEWKIAKPALAGMISGGPGADYHPEWPGGKSEGRSLFPAGGGPGLVKALRDAAEAKGVKVMVETSAKKLIQDAKTKEILGLIAESAGKELTIKARKGVILAAGGFPWNEEMVKHFLRGPSLPTSTLGNTGDGILMGMAIGADLRNMNEEWGMPVALTAGGTATLCASWTTGMPGAIVVNKYGERFYNEAGPYDTVKRAYDVYDSRFDKCEYLNVPAYAIVDADYVGRYTFLGVKPGEEAPKWMWKADTLRDLALALKIDPDALEKTVETFNGYAREGVDLEFHRGESLYDQSWGGDPSFKNSNLAPLETPPFYTVEMRAGNIGTCGGLRVNEKAQVLNPFEDVIPRLYAVGNNSGVGGPGVHYGGGGGTVGPIMTFGYIAALDAITLAAWE